MGLMLLSAFVLTTSCSKKDDDDPSPTTSKAKFYFEATLDGEKISIKDQKNGYGNGSGYSGELIDDGDHFDFQMFDFSTFSGFNSTDPAYYFGVVTYFDSTGTPSAEKRATAFKVGKYGFAVYDNFNLPFKEGASIEYYDENGDGWSTAYGTASQSGSSFEVLEFVENTDFTSYYIIKVKFNCTLYNYDGDKSKKLVGEARGRIIS